MNVSQITVGRIVHYTNLSDRTGDYPPVQQAAMVTAVNEDGTVALKIFEKKATVDRQSVPFAENYELGHWSLPQTFALKE